MDWLIFQQNRTRVEDSLNLHVKENILMFNFLQSAFGVFFLQIFLQDSYNAFSFSFNYNLLC